MYRARAKQASPPVYRIESVCNGYAGPLRFTETQHAAGCQSLMQKREYLGARFGLQVDKDVAASYKVCWTRQRGQAATREVMADKTDTTANLAANTITVSPALEIAAQEVGWKLGQ